MTTKALVVLSIIGALGYGLVTYAQHFQGPGLIGPVSFALGVICMFVSAWGIIHIFMDARGV